MADRSPHYCSCCGCWMDAPGVCAACWTHQRDGLPCDQKADDVGERAERNMRRFGIPSGTDNPELLALGAMPLEVPSNE